MPTLFDPLKLGALALPNRIIMAPLTRSRAMPDTRVPTTLQVDYYRQRAGAGLIISRSHLGHARWAWAMPPRRASGRTNRPKAGRRSPRPCMHAGGRMVLQLWHVGRISDPMFLDGALPEAPSAVQPKGNVSLVRPQTEFVTPRALERDEIPGVIAAFKRGAENAKRAGFDGVHIHGANGYLLDQFLQDSTNQRTDAYGGPRRKPRPADAGSRRCLHRGLGRGPRRHASGAAHRQPRHGRQRPAGHLHSMSRANWASAGWAGSRRARRRSARTPSWSTARAAHARSRTGKHRSRDQSGVRWRLHRQ